MASRNHSLLLATLAINLTLGTTGCLNTQGAGTGGTTRPRLPFNAANLVNFTQGQPNGRIIRADIRNRNKNRVSGEKDKGSASNVLTGPGPRELPPPGAAGLGGLQEGHLQRLLR
jgi:hypothetical protein